VDTKQEQVGTARAVLALVLLGVATVLLVRPPAQPTLAPPPEIRIRPAVEPGPIQPTQPSDDRPLTSERLDKALATAAAYLVRHCNADGRFTYRVNIDPRVEIKPGYNVLRHAGTIHALATYARQHPDEQLLDTLRRAARFLRETSAGPVEAEDGSPNDGLLAVWSKPEIELTDKPLRAQLGGTGLGLIALVSVERVLPGTTPLDDLRALGRFLLFMQHADEGPDEGRFYTEYIPSEGGRSDKRVVLYFPGEAALGLVMLYELDPSPEWLEAAAGALGYLARQREGRRRVEPDHWALLATARLLPQYDRLDEPPVSREALVRHAVQICEQILAERAAQPAGAVTRGCFTASGSTCPTATRLEGLLAALTFLPEDECADLRARIEAAARDGVAFLVRSQVADGPYAGGMPSAIARFPVGHPRYSKAFNDAATEIRIDFVQHAMSALMQYRDLVLVDETQ
jgi:hypothetical protein